MDPLNALEGVREVCSRLDAMKAQALDVIPAAVYLLGDERARADRVSLDLLFIYREQQLSDEIRDRLYRLFTYRLGLLAETQAATDLKAEVRPVRLHFVEERQWSGLAEDAAARLVWQPGLNWQAVLKSAGDV